MNSTNAYHGGDLQEAEALFGRPNAGWLDLSTGVNPEPYPNTESAASSWHRLPQRAPLDALLGAARRFYGVPDPVDIVAGPGSQAILQHLPGFIAARNVAVVGPTYAEHANLWNAHRHDVVTVPDLSRASAADVVVLVNPNNPDGRTTAPTQLIDVARHCTERDGLLVVDEAFADIDPETSLLPHLKGEAVLVIRSFGKFFGLPGLRLGFAAGAPGLVAKLEERLGPWAVSGPALEIGARALADDGWAARARTRMTERAGALDQTLEHAELQVVGGTALFRLVEDNAAPQIFTRLGKAGIFVRKFPERPEWLRFGVPGSDTDLQRLASALG